MILNALEKHNDENEAGVNTIRFPAVLKESKYGNLSCDIKLNKHLIIQPESLQYIKPYSFRR